MPTATSDALDLDLSPWAASAANVKVRFRHYEPRNDWYIRMDNVVIDDVPKLQHGNTAIFSEYFDRPARRGLRLGGEDEEGWLSRVLSRGGSVLGDVALHWPAGV